MKNYKLIFLLLCFSLVSKASVDQDWIEEGSFVFFNVCGLGVYPKTSLKIVRM